MTGPEISDCIQSCDHRTETVVYEQWCVSIEFTGPDTGSENFVRFQGCKFSGKWVNFDEKNEYKHNCVYIHRDSNQIRGNLAEFKMPLLQILLLLNQ